MRGVRFDAPLGGVQQNARKETGVGLAKPGIGGVLQEMTGLHRSLAESCDSGAEVPELEKRHRQK